jgi:ABC-type Fe3+/spermidine/putrescine transport system ATPase subunit
MVFQDLALWSHMTVAENVEFGLRARKLQAAERRRRINAVIELVGLGDYLESKPGELSGGEQQRVALARASPWRLALFSWTSRSGASMRN